MHLSDGSADRVETLSFGVRAHLGRVRREGGVDQVDAAQFDPPLLAHALREVAYDGYVRVELDLARHEAGRGGWGCGGDGGRDRSEMVRWC